MSKKELKRALTDLREKRQKLVDEMAGIVDSAAAETRDFTPDENHSRGRLEAQIAHMDEQIELREDELRKAKKEQRKKEMDDRIAAVRKEFGMGDQSGLVFGGNVSVGKEPRTYERGNGQSYLLDICLARTALGQGMGVRSQQAQVRLARHAQENHVIASEIDERMCALAEDKREKERRSLEGYFLSQMIEVHNDRARSQGPIASRALNYRALSTASTAGGEFTPPMYLTAEWIAYARPGRVLADLQHHEDLPDGTMSINIPKVTGGLAVGNQPGQNLNIPNVNMQTAFVTFPVVTKAGSQVVSLQLLERSPVNFDEIVGRELALAYAVAINEAVHSGAGTNGNGEVDFVGILNTSEINVVTWTQETPTLKGLYGQIGLGKVDVAKGRKLPAEDMVMTTSCWEWISQTFDTSNRPVVVPSYNGPFNAVAVPEDAATAEGVVGRRMQGLNTFEDLTLPTALGAGKNQDVILGGRFDENYLYESPLTTRMLPQTYGTQLSMLIQLYGYSAFTASRYPVANFALTGTGMSSANRTFNS